MLDDLGTDAERDLNDAQVAAARALHGVNSLPERPAQPAWRRFLRQFQQALIYILLTAALITAALGEWIDCARNPVSQPVFARYLNTNVSTVQNQAGWDATAGRRSRVSRV